MTISKKLLLIATVSFGLQFGASATETKQDATVAKTKSFLIKYVAPVASIGSIGCGFVSELAGQTFSCMKHKIFGRSLMGLGVLGLGSSLYSTYNNIKKNNETNNI